MHLCGHGHGLNERMCILSKLKILSNQYDNIHHMLVRSSVGSYISLTKRSKYADSHLRSSIILLNRVSQNLTLMSEEH